MKSCAWDQLIGIDSHQRLSKSIKWRELYDLIFFLGVVSFATRSKVMDCLCLPQMT